MAHTAFREGLRQELTVFLQRQQRRLPADEVLRIDLHCHDHNSDVPDELIGRILGCPETWTPTDEVLEALRRSGTDVVTITNHNNGRSCFELQDRGVDVLVGAEFTCRMPDFDARLHVLTYGFDPAQEVQLNRLRGDIYRFLDYTLANDLPTVLAHPLCFATSSGVPPLRFLEKLTLMFDAFEVLNGQRDGWQNLLIATWLQGITPGRIEAMADRLGIRPDRYCRKPYLKRMVGGSDCHFALFVGSAGALVHVPRLQQRLASQSRAALVLEALRTGGQLAPYGGYTGTERIAASLAELLCQAVMNMRDPGLMGVLLHQGGGLDKLTALAAHNLLMEVRRDRFTSRFLRTFHQAVQGRRPGFLLRRVLARPVRPLVRELDNIAIARQTDPAEFRRRLESVVPSFFHQLNTLLADRVTEKTRGSAALLDPSLPLRARRASGPSPRALGSSTSAAAADLIKRLELPAHLRSLLGGEADQVAAVRPANLGQWTEGLTFPFLSSLVLGGISYASTRYLFQNRRFLDRVADAVESHRHPQRALWLTDSFTDRNGVAHSLRLMHREVKRLDLPIDFLTCASDLEPDDHLQVLKPLAEFTTPLYREQPFRVFDLLELERLFIAGGYDRIVCSTEALMGLAALYLQQAFSVPAYFYLHTDWLGFAQRTLGLDASALEQIQGALGTLYRCFDGVFVLNHDQRDWLGGDCIGIPGERIFDTAHWVDPVFRRQPVLPGRPIPGVTEDDRVVLYVGRVSEEKGVLELPEIMRAVCEHVPRARLVVAGTGPAEARLRAELPDALFLGWVERERLARTYAVADLLLLPSRSDTFGCVVLEALSCGTPVVAYREKGPKEIVLEGECGLLADDIGELTLQVTRLLVKPELRQAMGAAALERAANYQAEGILTDLVDDLGLPRCPAMEQELRVAI